METETTKRTPNARPGWTLLECLLVVAIMAIVFAATVPLLHTETAALDAVRPMILNAQEARHALVYVASALRQARTVTEVTDGGGPNASIQFVAGDGTLTTFRRDAASGEVRYGPVGSEAVLAKHCTGLAVTCFAADAQALDSANLAMTAGVHVAMTVVDPEGKRGPTTAETLVALERTRPAVVINEIMYKPRPAYGPKDKHQWVELHNPTPNPVDVRDWLLWTKDQNDPDLILADAYHGTGTTVIPAGGYALLVDQDSELDNEILKDGDFEGGVDDWKFPLGIWWRDFGNAASGDYKIVLGNIGWTIMYQDFKIPADADADVQVTVRERYNPSAGVPNVRIRITDRHGAPLRTVYDGPCQADWTAHSADLAAFKDVDARLEISGYRAHTGKSWVRIDAATINWGPVSRNCVRLRVDDNAIGKNTEDKQIFLGEDNTLRDAVVFEKAWGGDDDGCSLSRTRPFDPATEEESWYPAANHGTPGEPNS